MVTERPAASKLPEQLAVHSFLSFDDRLLSENEQADDVGRTFQIAQLCFAEPRLDFQNQRSLSRIPGSKSCDVPAVRWNRVAAAPAVGDRLLELPRLGREHTHVGFEYR